jgi:prepilin peptidase dependent protein B
MLTTNPLSRRPMHGMSMVELLVGVALGLFVVAGVAALFVSHLTSGRTLLLEARVNQDLRAAADLVARDLRRAGYWGNALQGTVATGVATTPNPYRAVTDNTGANRIEYNFSRDVAENNTLDNNEQFGFWLDEGAVKFKTNGTPTWQFVTDPNIVTVTAFTITPTESLIDARESCERTCCSDADVVAGTCATANISAGQSCPTVTLRQYRIRLSGNATSDARVARSLETRARVRNEEFNGVCPT